MNKKQNSLMRFSRTERLAQLSEQEIVIERKKREIQAKIEAQKKKETEEALKKLESSKESKSNKIGVSKKFWSGSDCKRHKNDEKPPEPVKESLTNAFTNDGSFLDQFKKLSKSGLTSDSVDIHKLAQSNRTEDSRKTQELDKKTFKSRNIDYVKKDAYRFSDKSGKTNLAPNSDYQPFSDGHSSNSDFQMQLPSSTSSKMVSQEPDGSEMSSANNQISMVSSNSIYIPQFQATQSQLSVNNKSNSLLKSHNCSSSSSVKSVPYMQDPIPSSVSEFNQDLTGTSKFSSDIFPTSSVSSVQPFHQVISQNIPPPSVVQLQNTRPLARSFKDSELPKHRTESISLSLKPNVTKKLEAIPNPLDVDQPPSPQNSSVNFPNEKELVNTSQISSSASKSQNVSSNDKQCLRISSAFYDDNEDEDVDCLTEKCLHWAQLVAHCGDDFENSLRDRNSNDPNLRFLFNKNSKEYLLYRKLVLKYRQQQGFSEPESSQMAQQKSLREGSKDKQFSNIGNSDSDSCDGKDILSAEHFGSHESKETKAQCNQAEESKMSETISTKYRYQTDPERSPKDNETEIPDQARAEERRKRKRKSRWGDVVTTVNPPGVVGNLSVQPPGKIPASKSTLLSQVTRSDPGLINYARQTFGSTNLSEEDWKKAEDHYKINLLYQDMVKKRAEVEKLEKQGKFKYEYDSDEDTEGGTWEHKLRQQEMQATQLWAEELTRQAAGKHHIGDFLPPEELERFMEKYNAVKEGREPDLSDYKEYKLKQDNVGYRILQKMGWNEGQGLGQDGSGIQNPVNKATTRHENQGLGVERPDGLEAGDDEYDAYRKRMMLAYRFRPNPLNNPRRPYY